MGKHALTTDRTRWDLLTPPRRKAIYGIVAALLALGMAYGMVTPEQSTHWLDVADKALGLIALVMATMHTGGVYESPVYGEKDAEEPGA